MMEINLVPLPVVDTMSAFCIRVQSFLLTKRFLSTCWEPSDQRIRVSYASKAMKNLKQSRCVIGIKGQTPDPDFPVDIWFDSLKSVANVLSKENQQLLKIIAEQQPQSVTELSVLTGRAVSNVSRTLKTLEDIGIVQLVKLNKSTPSKSISLIHANFLVLV